MKFMDNKGQMSVEYLLIVLVVILVLSLVTLPLISDSIDASNDISHASDAKVAASTIANAADTVYANGPNSKRTISFYIPEDTNITFNNKKVIIPVKLYNGTKNKDVPKYIEVNTQCNSLTINLPSGSNSVEKGWYDATVVWDQYNGIILGNVTKTS